MCATYTEERDAHTAAEAKAAIKARIGVRNSPEYAGLNEAHNRLFEGRPVLPLQKKQK